MRNKKGQVILILILVMTVALAIGLSVIQRSLSDISTSTKVEQSSRAFSAAEAGIEKALRGDTSGVNFADTASSAQVTVQGTLPGPGQALEYPPISKEEVAQVWLADPLNLNPFYTQSSIAIYWGVANSTSDKPAIEVTVVYLSGSFNTTKFYYDSDTSRTSFNRFTDASSGCNNPAIPTTSGSNRTFFCKTTLTGLLPTLILLRARILYSSSSQPFAVAPVAPGSLPPQAKIITSTGTAGDTQRKVQVFRLDKVVAPYFDYAIFSVGEIKK